MRIFVLALAALLIITPFQQSCQLNGKPKVLVFSLTKGYRHASIEKGQAAIQLLGKEHGFEVILSESPTLFTDDSLKLFKTVIFLSTTGDILNSQQEAAFMRYIQAGGGFVGVHAAADTEYGWPWYGKLVGAYFHSHPKQANAKIKVSCDGHQACKHLATEWTRWDEWYNYRDVQPDLKVIASLDETSYTGGNMKDKHPIAWYHEFDGGKAFYTGLGHTDTSFVEKPFLQHLLGGIQYAMDHKALDYSKAYTASIADEDRFEKTVLASNLDEPMQLDIFKDGGVLIAERKGKIKLYNPQTGLIEYVANKNVHTKYEDGLLGIAIDPNYDENNFLYLFYSPLGTESVQHVSRFLFKDKVLDTTSEKIILKIPVQRQECCHSAGYIKFGDDGLFYISVGDNTNPFASDGFSPIDERAGRMPWDAQKSSGNTNDLRGKILRIKLKADGTYDIPEGNLFKPGTPKTKPEIFAMGCRNPFRFSVDAKRNLVHWGDVGPDSGTDSVGRGPKGYDFIGQAGVGGGFFGWPYIRGNGHQYHDYDFTTQKSGEKFDPNHIINNSPNNTGMTELPPYKAPKLWYSYDQSREFPFVGIGGKNPMAGPIYYSTDFVRTDQSFPSYFDGKLFIYEWMRRWIYIVTLDKEHNFIKYDQFMPGTTFANPMDMKFGPDGTLYVLNYGTKWFAQNEDAQLFKIDFNGGNRKPIAKMKLDKYSGSIPLTIVAEAAGTTDPDRENLQYNWVINGIPKAKGEKATLEISAPGDYDIVLEVIDGQGGRSLTNAKVLAGNEMPEVNIEVFGNKSFFWPGRKIPYSISITDKEDGSNASGTLTPENIKVSAAFVQEGQDLAKLAAVGHLAGMNQSPFESGRLLIEKSDCKTCHANDKAINGPAYNQVAQRYSGKPDAEAILIQKVIHGGTGNWGDRAMAAHPQLSVAEVGLMIKYILALAGPKDNSAALSNLLSGVIDVKESGSGQYVITVGYTDRGYNGIPPLANQKTVFLKSNMIKPIQAEIRSKGVSIFEVNGTSVCVLNNKTHVGFKDIDFKDLKGVDIQYAASHAGKLELKIDDPEKGDKVGEITVKPSELQVAPKQYTSTASIKFTKGTHTLYLIYITDDTTAASAACTPTLLSFKLKEGI